MKVRTLCLLPLMSVSLCFGQNAAPNPPQSTTQNAIGHGAFPVKVAKTLDSSKLKEGDAVEVETAGGFKLPNGTLVPKGSRLAGHVTSAKAKSKGDTESQLAIVFDKLRVANGEELPVKGTIQALFPPAAEADPGLPPASAHQGGNGAGLTGGSVPTPEYKPTSDIKTGVEGSSNHAEPALNPQSVGVQGFDNLDLKDGILTSKGKNVKLGSGVRMIVRADIYK